MPATPHRLEEPSLQAAVEARRLQACRVLNTRSFAAPCGPSSASASASRRHNTAAMVDGREPLGDSGAKVLVDRRTGAVLIYQAATNPARVVRKPVGDMTKCE